MQTTNHAHSVHGGKNLDVGTRFNLEVNEKN